MTFVVMGFVVLAVMTWAVVVLVRRDRRRGMGGDEGWRAESAATPSMREARRRARSDREMRGAWLRHDDDRP